MCRTCVTAAGNSLSVLVLFIRRGKGREHEYESTSGLVCLETTFGLSERESGRARGISAGLRGWVRFDHPSGYRPAPVFEDLVLTGVPSRYWPDSGKSRIVPNILARLLHFVDSCTLGCCAIALPV